MLPFLGAIGSALGGMFSAANIGSTLTGIGGLLGGVSGMRQAGQRGPTVHQNLMDQAKGARDASAEYGFNPLTLLQYGQTGASTGNAGGAAPLRSIEMLSGGLAGLSDVLTGKTATEAAHRKLDLELKQIALQQARSGVVLGPATGASDVGGSRSPLGSRAAQVAPGLSGGPRLVQPRMSAGLDRPLMADGQSEADPRREVDNQPIKTHAGLVVIDNPNAQFPVYSVTRDGDEAAQLWDLPMLAGEYFGSAVYDLYRRKRDTGTFLSPAQREELEYKRAWREEAAEKRRERRKWWLTRPDQMMGPNGQYK